MRTSYNKGAAAPAAAEKPKKQRAFESRHAYINAKIYVKTMYIFI